MILDTLDNLDKIVDLNPLFKVVVEFVRDNDLDKLEAGKHMIQGDEVFVNVQVAKGKTAEEAVLETHEKMIDIQIPISGEETFGYLPACELPPLEYNAEKDITKFPGVKSLCHVTCRKGMFVVFVPQDGHAPCITPEPELKKAIFKVAVR